ncbi:MAG: hypothetical protein MK089_12165, partial [Phycisphaerales bacterium]|nr:hypothetical protein [Phycisphaerales bacterium]
GGGITAENMIGHLALHDSQVTGNEAQSCAAITVTGATSEIINCVISENRCTADFSATADHNPGHVDLGTQFNLVQGCHIHDNTHAIPSAASYAIGTVRHTLEIHNSNISSNTSGGVLHRHTDLASAYLLVSNCVISNHNVTSQPEGYGAGIRQHLALSNSGTACLIDACDFSDNHAIHGGAVHVSAGGTPIRGCDFVDNVADKGGAVYLYSDNLTVFDQGTIDDCLFLGNTSTISGDNIYHHDLGFQNPGAPSIARSSFTRRFIQGSPIFGSGSGTGEYGGRIEIAGDSPQMGGCCHDFGCMQATSYFCNSIDGAYLGDFVDCSTSDCVRGACCASTTECAILTQAQCIATGGDWRGEGSTCLDCSITDGACCTVNGCTTLDLDECLLLGGQWLGAAATCSDCPPTCLGDLNGDRDIDIDDLLGMLQRFGIPCP